MHAMVARVTAFAAAGRGCEQTQSAIFKGIANFMCVQYVETYLSR